jgi:ADP-ribose pyrophosphatase YjhB (NUDIX family)
VAEYVRRLRGIVGGDEVLQVPSVSIALRDDDGRVLLARHTEGDVWVLPGGAIEPGEVPSDAAVREMFEETGFLVRLTGLLGVFGGPEFIVRYRNGHKTSYLMAVFEAELDGGSSRPDAREVSEVRFVNQEETETLFKAAWVDEVLDAVFRGGRARGFRPETWYPAMPT